MRYFKGRFKTALLGLAGFLCFPTIKADAQELFTYTEPASNMPAHSIGLRANFWGMRRHAADGINYHFLPEVMWGVNKNLMLHAEGFFSNRTGALSSEGGGVYAKYRFLSKDGDHRHFRMAAFGRASYNKVARAADEIETGGMHTGAEGGVVATQLLRKTAISLSASYERGEKRELVVDDVHHHPRHEPEVVSIADQNALNYTLSVGQLILPKRYTGYNQTNLNLMLEVLGQQNLNSGLGFTDIAPSVQFIFNSQTRVDVGYRHQLYGNMERVSTNGLLLRVEHLLFNVL